MKNYWGAGLMLVPVLWGCDPGWSLGIELIVDGRVPSLCVEKAIEDVTEIAHKGGSGDSFEYEHKLTKRRGFVNLSTRGSRVVVTVGWGALEDSPSQTEAESLREISKKLGEKVLSVCGVRKIEGGQFCHIAGVKARLCD